jgi:TRAP transporter TAXI family solute receptor
MTSALGVSEAQRVNMTYMSASSGGAWYPVAVSMGELWSQHIPELSFTHTPGGGISNVIGVETGKAQIGITMSIGIGDAIVGNSPFKKKATKIRALAYLFPQFVAIMAFKKSDIKQITDLKGKRLANNKKGWTTEAVVNRWFKAIGMKYGDLARVEFVTAPEAINLMKDGHVDACVAGVAAQGDPKATELSVFNPIRVIPVSDEALATMQAQGPGIYKGFLPKGSYKGIDTDVAAILVRTGVIVSADLSNDLAYKMTKVLAENWKKDMQPVMKALAKVKPQELSTSLGTDFHPGAAQYYREKGWLK